MPLMEKKLPLILAVDDEASNLHLKVLVIERYDSTPEGREPEDIDYSILLLWKL